MPPSADDQDQATAVAAQALFLLNLLLLPGLGFLLLLGLWLVRRGTAGALAQAHLAQALSGSLWAGLLLVLVNGLILLLGGYQGPQVWVVLILYFTSCHALLVLCGAMGLARALAGQCWRFPLIGRPLPLGC